MNQHPACLQTNGIRVVAFRTTVIASSQSGPVLEIGRVLAGLL